jgi:TolB-like protein
MAAVVSQQTKGLIREYRVVSTAQDGPVWTVQLEATIARYTKSPQSNRLRITVLPFRVKNAAQKEAAERFASELNANLTQSRKFAMLDRQFEAERQEEMAINASADTSIEEMAKLGNRLGTDYMIVGVIEDGGVTTQSTQLAGRMLSSSTARLSVSYRVIDAPTGQVKFADSWSRSGEGQSVAALAAKAAETISREIVEAIAPLAVESVDGNTVYLGQGGKSIKSGQRYRLMKMGEPIVDRYTGESLGRQETEVGVIEITDVQTKLAKARIIESRVDIAAEFRSASFVVRPIAQPAQKRPSTGTAKNAGASQPKSGLQKLKSTTEGDW